MVFVNYLIRNYFAQILCSDLLFILSCYFFQPSLVSVALNFLWLSLPLSRMLYNALLLFVLSQVPLLNFLAG